MNLFKLLSFIAICVLLFDTETYAYSVKTHKEITEKAFKQSISLPDKNFLSALGYSSIYDKIEVKDSYCDPEDELDVCFNVSKTILDWMKYGSEQEDATLGGGGNQWFRYMNHFYDPHNDSGYKYGTLDGEKAYIWALESEDIPGQRYSIEDAKDYYEIGLTADTKDERDTYLAKTFRTLGHVVHLVQDMGQPQHTRNDSHGGVFGALGEKSQYETQLKKNPPETTCCPDSYPPSFDSYADFFSTADDKGLADFSNSNFVTAGTNNWKCNLPDEPYGDCINDDYPNPRINFTEVEVVDVHSLQGVSPDLEAGDVTFFKNRYTDKYNNEDIINPKLTTYSIFDKDLKKKLKNPAFTLNRFNYTDMAKILVPRAVGYSAGLLNYFFRGEIDIKDDPEEPGKFIIYNNSFENLSGTFDLYYDDSQGTRAKVSEGSSVSIPARGSSTGVPFLMEADNNEYTLVFNGKLGNEENAVIGKVVELKGFVNHAFIIQEEVIAENLHAEELYYEGIGRASMGYGCQHHPEFQELYDPSDGYSGCYTLDTHEELWYGSGWGGWHTGTEGVKQNHLKGRFIIYGLPDSIRAWGKEIEFSVDGQSLPSNEWTSQGNDTIPSSWEIIGDTPYSITITYSDGTVIMQNLICYEKYEQQREKSALHASQYFTTNGNLVIQDNPSTFHRRSSRNGAFKISESNNTKYNSINSLVDYSYTNDQIYELTTIGGRTVADCQNASNCSVYGFNNTFWEYQESDLTEEFGPLNYVSTTMKSNDYFNTLELPEELPPFTAEIERIYSQEELDYLSELEISPQKYQIKFLLETTGQ